MDFLGSFLKSFSHFCNAYALFLGFYFIYCSDNLREHLKNAPKQIMERHQDIDTSDSSSNSDDSSSGNN